MNIPDTTSLAPPRSDEAQVVDSYSMEELYLFFREKIYPTINTHMPRYKAFFMSPLVQRWLDRNCPAGKDWRKRYLYKVILKTIKEIEKESLLSQVEEIIGHVTETTTENRDTADTQELLMRANAIMQVLIEHIDTDA
ncbi:hypothetical protein HK104_007936 [Borealophlyctis nickersoniae]|nr:hypothetical protein HK104_007936 [Borealophlyctis nickersoniae]